MHSSIHHGITFIHHGDYAGKTEIILPKAAIKPAAPGNVYVEVPFQALLEFVAEYVVQQRITKLEQAEPEEVFGLNRR
jgi:hypothetical protein